MTTDFDQSDPWKDDRLGRRTFANDVTRILTSDSSAKVVAIHGAFGTGKSFFAKRLAAHLRNKKEIVIEFDAWKTDSSGDPLVAFAATLLANFQPEDTASEARKQAFLKARSYVGTVVKAAAKVVLREGVDELAELGAGQVLPEKFATDVSTALSKKAEADIEAVLEAERTRVTELPSQLNSLRLQMTEGAPSSRVIVIVDELDRCRPNYALELLEAIKHLFDLEGFIFVLIANFERIKLGAEHTFGSFGTGEEYLERFIDLPLVMPKAVSLDAFALNLLKETSYGQSVIVDGELELMAAVFSIKSLQYNLSPREMARLSIQIDVASRLKSAEEIDGPYLAWATVARSRQDMKFGQETAFLQPDEGLDATPEVVGDIPVQDASYNASALELIDSFESAEKKEERLSNAKQFATDIALSAARSLMGL